MATAEHGTAALLSQVIEAGLTRTSDIHKLRMMLLTRSVLTVKFALTRIRCIEFHQLGNVSPEFGSNSVPMHKLHPSLSSMQSCRQVLL